MTTNVLLIIIIVLLVLSFFFQLLQFVAIYTLPERLVDSFLDFFTGGESDSEAGTIIDLVDVAPGQRSHPTNLKGFGNSKKSKQSKRSWSRRADQTSKEASQTKVETTDANADVQ